MERGGETFHLAPDFQMYKVGIYLQPNGPDGGGLDLVPGSHTQSDRYAGDDPPATPPGTVLSVPSSHGDVVLWHWRVYHRATPSTSAGQTPQRKLAVFLTAASESEGLRQYGQWARNHAWTADHPYPDDLLDRARQTGLRLL
jgi:ectoine hydroxylase-related dioxygenase (phytanoyl-CoA dioxygenase family)